MRDLAAAFIEAVLDVAELDSDFHRDYCARRIGEGAEEYGELAFFDAACAREAMEEGMDGANWLALESIRAGNVPDWMVAAAAHYLIGAELIRRNT